jgi:predicted DNA-binding protein
MPPVEEKQSVLQQLMTAANTEKEATVRVTVDLPKSMHQQLSLFCAQTGRKKAEVIRMLLEEALKTVNQ